jgi:hypothetical protein
VPPHEMEKREELTKVYKENIEIKAFCQISENTRYSSG